MLWNIFPCATQVWSVFDINYCSARCELRSSPLLRAVYPSDEKQDSEQDSELPVSAARPARTSSFPKRLTSIRGELWIFTNPSVFWLLSSCRRCSGSASLVLKRTDLALAHTVCARCSHHKLVVFFYFWLGDHVFLTASGACFWQSGLLCGLSALLFLVKISLTREEWRSAHRHCWGETRRWKRCTLVATKHKHLFLRYVTNVSTAVFVRVWKDTGRFIEEADCAFK